VLQIQSCPIDILQYGLFKARESIDKVTSPTLIRSLRHFSLFANVESLAARRNGQNRANKRYTTFPNAVKDREVTVEESAKSETPQAGQRTWGEV